VLDFGGWNIALSSERAKKLVDLEPEQTAGV
jgi:hypothetical protein